MELYTLLRTFCNKYEGWRGLVLAKRRPPPCRMVNNQMVNFVKTFKYVVNVEMVNFEIQTKAKINVQE